MYNSKIFISFFIIILSMGSVNFSQNNSKLGLKAGLNFATTNDENSGIILGFIGGGFFTHYFTDNFAIQPEILFTMKGEKLSETIQGFGIIHSDIINNFIEVPLLGKVILSTNTGINPNFVLGPFLSLSTNTFNTTDWGIIIGSGADFYVAKLKLLFDIRYSVSLKNSTKIHVTLSDNTGNIVYANERYIKNRVISIMLGISF